MRVAAARQLIQQAPPLPEFGHTTAASYIDAMKS
jgi:hypothetical protein